MAAKGNVSLVLLEYGFHLEREYDCTDSNCETSPI